MKITKSEFSISSATVSQCPKDTKPEYAFIGRSNVGKSSLINMLCNHKGLAKTSSTPGKTLLINHFIINNEWYLVDLLTNVFVLVDIRHDPQQIDREFIDWLGKSEIPFALIFTKADKLAPSKMKQQAEAYMSKLEDTWEILPPYFISSAEKAYGREEILDYIDQINKEVAG